MSRKNTSLSHRALGLALFLSTSTLAAQSAASRAAGEDAPQRKEAASPGSLHWGDYDGDGLADALTVHGDGRLGLRRNLGDGLFEVVTELAGLGQIAGATLAVFQDYDLDGRVDLFIGTARGAAYLMNNRGETFEDAAPASGIDAMGFDRSAHWIDYDGDGRLDLHLVTGERNAMYHALGDGRFEAIELPSLGAASSPGGRQVLVTGSSTNVFESADSTGAPRPTETELVVTPGARVGVTNPKGKKTAAVAGLSCVTSLLDANGGGCIQASTAGELGMLYPLSETLFVDDALGHVGLGTTTPSAELHVLGSGFFGPDAGNLGSAAGQGVRVFVSAEQGTVYAYDYGAGSSIDLLLQSAGGRVGVGLPPGTEPASRLDVSGGVTISGGSAELNVEGDAFFDGSGFFGEDAGGLPASAGKGVRLFHDTTFDQGILFSYDYGAAESKDLMLQGPGGSVGIGLPVGGSPLSALDVNGAITIRGGADLVERFESSCGLIEPGTVVAIDPENPGQLMCSKEAYDGKVAGVVSGAGGVNPGLCLGQEGVLDGDTPVAMTGRVYVKCSIENGVIRPGDRLTTAALEGHAMKATDEERAPGTVIGKAMSSLEEATGLVLVLVNLQ